MFVLKKFHILEFSVRDVQPVFSILKYGGDLSTDKTPEQAACRVAFICCNHTSMHSTDFWNIIVSAPSKLSFYCNSGSLISAFLS